MKNVQFKTSEEALETLRLATEAANLGVFDLNVETGDLHWSEFAKAIFGVTGSGPFKILDLLDRVAPEDWERVSAALEAALDGGGSGEYDIEYAICRPSGERRFVHAKGKAFFEQPNNRRHASRFVGTLLDRTDQRLSQAALAQAEQLAATGRLAASIAHEINNPLEGITNLLFLLRDEVPEGPGREYLLQAESELARVSEIATNTLRFYRDPKEITSVELSGLTHSVISLFNGRLAIRGIELDYVCSEPVRVTAPQGELRQVLVNLIGNAVDAMPSGGRLRIRCKTFRNHLARHERGVGISIADTGTGMTPDVFQKAFEPFYTTKGSAGTGLGLWLSSEIMKKHEFQMRVRTKPGKGTVFSLFLPERVQP